MPNAALNEISVDCGLLKFLVFGLGENLVLSRGLAERLLCLSLVASALVLAERCARRCRMRTAGRSWARNHSAILGEKLMHVRVPCPPKGLVTAQAPPIKKQNFKFNRIFASEISLFFLICEGAICAQAAGILEQWHLIACIQMLLQFPVFNCQDLASVLPRPGLAAGKVSFAFQPQEQGPEGAAKYSVICS